MKRWCKIKNTNSYSISELGEVINNKTGKILKNQYKKDKYPVIKVLYNNIKYKELSIHRLLAECFIPNPNSYKEVNHIDGNKNNYSLFNLEWCTHQQNIQHSWDNNFQIRPNGELNGSSILTEKEILEIRAIGKGNTSKIMKLYNISRTTSKDIVARRTWKHI